MTRSFDHVRFISAGAGSGKTYRLTEELERALVEGGVEPRGVIGTTFTVKAAAELRGRVRERLIRSGRPELAEQTAQALVGTVHAVCQQLLRRFAFELGLSPELSAASLEDCRALFNQALDDALSAAIVRRMNGLAWRLGIEDWRKDVKDVVDRARDNDIAADRLRAMGPPSADSLLAFFPEPKEGPWDDRLFRAVRRALDEIDPEVDTTKTTHGYVASLRSAIYELRRPPVRWALWMSLSRGHAAKKSDATAGTVRAAAAVFEQHPKFHRAVREYTESVFAIAADALARFQAIKTERGLIDFSDMEQLTLGALDQEPVRTLLGDELELLLVDEFQDTNPIQLAIFMKLAELADNVVFVGDVKQAIYAFRGCVPELVFDALEKLGEKGSRVDVLEHSWRSRPALVHYINAVFSNAFAGEIPAEQVRLKPQRSEATDEPAVISWRIDGNKDAAADAVARAIVNLVQSQFLVVDPETGGPRPARWGDVAVLARTNDDVERTARALRAAHVPMKMTLEGLLAVPEVCLARACLRRLNDQTDTLATAEILAMAECTEPEEWLAERFDWLARGEDAYGWGETTHPILISLARLRDEISAQSPVEIVARVLNYIGIRDVVTAWGPNAIKAMQRQRNLDALLDLAVEYERHCDAQHQAATLTGFLFWLEHPHSPELDLQPVVTSGDAVHVLTYHRSKGLEWPIVIATDLHADVRSRLFGVRVGDGEEFDPLAPLEGRTIRFWPDLFGRRTKLPAIERIAESDTGRAAVRSAEAEDRRLAYVGLTRARDCIVLAAPARKPGARAWIRTFAGEYLLPEGDIHELGDGLEIPARVLALGDDAAHADPPYFAPRRLPARTPLADPAREIVVPSAALPLDAAVAETTELGERMALHGDDMNAIGSALHALIAAELLNPDRDDAPERARALLDGFGVGTFIDPEEALAAARRFRAWVERRFAPSRVLVEHPIVHRMPDRRTVRGWIDLLLETDAGWVVIDHKSSPRPRSEWSGEALEHSGQLDIYRKALEAAGEKVAACWIHYPVTGGAVAVEATDGSARRLEVQPGLF